jgi:hypothetical protein
VVREQASPEPPGADDDSESVFVLVPGVRYVAEWEKAEELLCALREIVTAYGSGWLLLRARVRVMPDGSCVLDLGGLHPHAARQWARLVRQLVALGATWERVA